MTLEERLEGLDRSGLRRVAWEALERSDGPEQIAGDVDDTYAVRVNPLPAKSYRIFATPTQP